MRFPCVTAAGHRDEMSSLNDVQRTALRWFVCLRGNPGDAERRRFTDWIDAAPAHHAAYQEIERTWRRSDVAGQRVLARARPAVDRLLAEIEAQDHGRGLPRGGARPGSAVLAVAASLCLMLFTGAVWLEAPTFLQDLAADQVAPRGERRMVPLPDGSSVLMDAGSAISMDFGADTRRVRLLRGAAYFSVVAAAAPFTVASGDGEARVVGTRFEVRQNGDGTTVTVAEGQVRVQAPDQSAAALFPGQQTHYGKGGVGVVSAANLPDVFSWHDGRLVFYQVPLRDVVARLEPYGSGRILILGGELAERRVSGSFPSDDSEAALDSLASILGFRHHTIAGRLTLLRQ